MSDLERPSTTVTPPHGHDQVPPLVALDGGGEADPPTATTPPTEPEAARARPKIKWLRLLALLAGLGTLAAVSTVFGMMMAVASDLPALDVFQSSEAPSRIYDRNGRPLGMLTGNERRIVVRSEQIAPVMKQAVVAIEDKRFYEHGGVDFRGIARALYQDVVARKAVQGGSTITQQLVKNRLEAQNERTVLQKLRESAVAFHMTRKWDKPRILTNYLNTIYFGNGAYGIETAARTYFGSQHVGCGERGQRTCAEQLEPHEAALLAAIIASPSLYDPTANPEAATARRNLVLQRMREQGYLSRSQEELAASQPLPARADISPPQEETRHPYFTTWVRQQVVDQVGAGAAFEGGLKVRTTIDSKLQEAAENAVRSFLGDNQAPAAAMVALDNRTSEVVAMVGGPLTAGAFNKRPFNLATQGQRQPGSAFKPFILAEALRQGRSPNQVYSSRKKEFCVTRRKGRCAEAFVVNNYEDRYAGSLSLAQATAFSDNTIYAELGIDLGLANVARMARRMGIRTPVSTNPAITLGGLKQGVTVLDMAHAYQPFARRGRLPYGTLSPGADGKGAPGPVGIRRITDRRDEPVETLDGDEAVNRTRAKRVLSDRVAVEAQAMLSGVVKYGTGKRAALGPDIPAWGKTGTTEDYGDAWFVGSTPRYTVAVWVGYPDEVRPMKPPNFNYQGEPVAGGTYPAAIWQSFMKQAEAIWNERRPDDPDDDAAGTGAPPVGSAAPAEPTPAPEGQGEPVPPAQPEETAPTPQQAPARPKPQQPQQPEQPEQQSPPPAPAPQQPSGGGNAAPQGGGGASAPGDG